MTDAEIEQRAAEEAFLRGFHDIPDDEKLQQMSFVELAALLSSCEYGSARYLVVEQEILRRKSAAPSETPIEIKNGWIHRNGSNLILGVLASLIAAALWFLYGPK